MQTSPSVSPMSVSSASSTCSVDSFMDKEPTQPRNRRMSRQPIQQRLYIINRSGTGEAQYVLLNQKRTEIESFSVRMENWKLTKGISNFGVAVVNNILFIIGGYDIKNCRHLHRVVKYDPYEFTWTECAPLLKSRAKFGVCVLKDQIYVCGGERSDGQASCSCEVYNPETDTWSEAGLMVAPRKNHCCVTVGTKMYCAGGDLGVKSHENLWCYENDRWEELDRDCPVKLPKCIDRYAMCTLGQKMFFVGGVSWRTVGEETRFCTERSICSFNPHVTAGKQKTPGLGFKADVISPWTTKYPAMVRPRHSCGAHAIGNKIYVFGGCHLDTGQDVRVCEGFDTTKGNWEDEFHIRKGDMSNVVTSVLEVPRRQPEEKVRYRLKWVLW